MADNINMEQIVELLTKLRTDIQEDIQASKREVIAYIENGVEKDIKILAEGHHILLDKLPEQNRVDDLNDRVTTVETVMKNHTQAISDIKKKIAI